MQLAKTGSKEQYLNLLCSSTLDLRSAANKSTLSRHVATLKNVGIVGERREGVRVYLRLLTPCVLKMFDCAMGVVRAEAKRHAELLEDEKSAAR